MVDHLKLANNVLKLKLKSKFWFRKLGFKQLPIGQDYLDNLYFDYGTIRKVERPLNTSLMPVVIPEAYSDWLTYKLDEFPKFKRMVSSDYSKVLSERYKLSLQLVSRGVIAYKQDDLVILVDLGKSFARI